MQRLTKDLPIGMSPAPTLRRRFQLPRPLMLVLGAAAVVLLLALAWQFRPKPAPAPYRTAAVERGSITKAVSASGTLQALITVDVGSQISGQIKDVKVDFNDQVKKGQVMAVLDPQTYQSRVAQELADVAAAEAAERQAEAQAANAKADFGRKQAMVEKGFDSPAVLDLAKATWLAADAAVAASKARVGQVNALLNSNRVDLTRTIIVAPIDGVVVDRKINPGQTVAASFQAPVLFTLAQDLSKLQVKISVDEADVGQVRDGQRVKFSVDAFPDNSFEGVVTQVRKQPSTEQNVVAYTVIAQADNPQMKLLPGMTANADIIIEVHPDVLKVPAAALRWKPGANGATTQTAMMFGTPPPGMGGRPVAQSQSQSQGKGPQKTGVVYLLKDGKPAPVSVRVGASDGTNTEVAGALRPGEPVITGGGPKAKPKTNAPFGRQQQQQQQQGGARTGGGAQMRIGG
jgi:HlyD family secretion protein